MLEQSQITQKDIDLYNAVEKENFNLVQELLKKKANPSALIGNKGDSSLHLAAWLLNVPIMKILIDASQKIDQEDIYGATLAHKIAACKPNQPKILIFNALQCLYNHSPYIITAVSKITGETALYCAIDEHNIPAILILRAFGADKGEPYSQSWTPLDKANQVGQQDVINALTIEYELLAKHMIDSYNYDMSLSFTNQIAIESRLSTKVVSNGDESSDEDVAVQRVEEINKEDVHESYDISPESEFGGYKELNESFVKAINIVFEFFVNGFWSFLEHISKPDEQFEDLFNNTDCQADVNTTINTFNPKNSDDTGIEKFNNAIINNDGPILLNETNRVVELPDDLYVENIKDSEFIYKSPTIIADEYQQIFLEINSTEEEWVMALIGDE